LIFVLIQVRNISSTNHWENYPDPYSF